MDPERRACFNEICGDLDWEDVLGDDSQNITTWDAFDRLEEAGVIIYDDNRFEDAEIHRAAYQAVTNLTDDRKEETRPSHLRWVENLRGEAAARQEARDVVGGILEGVLTVVAETWEADFYASMPPLIGPASFYADMPPLVPAGGRHVPVDMPELIGPMMGNIQEADFEDDRSSGDDDDSFETDNETDILGTEDETGSNYDGDDEDEDIIFRTRYCTLAENVDSGTVEVERAEEGPAGVEPDVAEGAVGYVDIIPLFQPLFVWDEYLGEHPEDDYFQLKGISHNHREMSPEELAAHEAQFVADMEEMGGDRGYCSDFVPDEYYEADLRWENYGSRMTDPEDEGEDDDDTCSNLDHPERTQEYDDRNPEEHETEEEEAEDWDVTNPV